MGGRDAGRHHHRRSARNQQGRLDVRGACSTTPQVYVCVRVCVVPLFLCLLTPCSTLFPQAFTNCALSPRAFPWECMVEKKHEHFRRRRRHRHWGVGVGAPSALPAPLNRTDKYLCSRCLFLVCLRAVRSTQHLLLSSDRPASHAVHACLFSYCCTVNPVHVITIPFFFFQFFESCVRLFLLLASLNSL